jgi:hypothetical protein
MTKKYCSTIQNHRFYFMFATQEITFLSTYSTYSHSELMPALLLHEISIFCVVTINEMKGTITTPYQINDGSFTSCVLRALSI